MILAVIVKFNIHKISIRHSNARTDKTHSTMHAHTIALNLNLLVHFLNCPCAIYIHVIS